MFELMNELVAAEGKGKKKKRKNKDFAKQDGKQVAFGVANKGHWKSNCPIFKAAKNKGMKSIFLLERCLVQNPTDSWCMDSGCTNHICNSLQEY